jgi:hypothetical protein
MFASDVARDLSDLDATSIYYGREESPEPAVPEPHEEAPPSTIELPVDEVDEED